MRGFLKCYYGYQNLWDELLFFGVLDYIDVAYHKITDLTVEVGDERWMQDRRDRNLELLKRLGLASGFVTGDKTLRFVKKSKNILDNRSYDLYFFGGGETFAESRGFHWGRNYLLRYPWPILRRRFVLLGGIETASKRRQQWLYRMVLPRAQQVMCRDETSYHEVKSYTDKTDYTHDFAITLIDAYKAHCSAERFESDRITKPYVIVNIVSSLATDANFEKIRVFLDRHYPKASPVFVAGKSINSDDVIYADRLAGVYDNLQKFDRTEHDVSSFLSLFHHAEAGIGSRLHVLLLLQAFEKPRVALSYAEKVDKLIQSTIEL